MKVKNEITAGGIVYKKIKSQTSNIKIMWLVCRHSQHKGWVFPKGLIGDRKTNEQKETAALREVEEEGGVKAKISHPAPIIAKYTYRWRGSPHAKDDDEEFLVYKTVYYFLMEYVSGDPKNHDWEMMDAKFVPEEEVKKLLTYPSDKKAFEEALKLHNP